MSKLEPKEGVRVLSFDGPPFPEAALSELFFLKQIAHRWAFKDDDEEDIEGDDVRINNMFDIVGGSGMGGLYAILLARLDMTIGQVIQFHSILIQKLFTAACWAQKDHQECTEAFDDALDEMLSRTDITVDLNSPFQSNNCSKCFVVVLNNTKSNASHPRLLRSCRVRIGPSPRCSIRQALHATLADLEHLPAVNIDNEHFICASAVFSNPSHILLNDLSDNFRDLHLSCLVNVGADWTCPANDSHRVVQALKSQFWSLDCFFRLTVREELNSESEITSAVMGCLQEVDMSNMLGDIVDALNERKGVVNMLRLKDLAGEDGKHGLRAEIAQLRNEGKIKQALKKLRGPFSFPSLHEHGCLEGTRVDVLEHIEWWAKNDDVPNVFWLEGYPGTGKTFISISLKQRLAEAGLLGASCFFRREDASHHRLDTLIRSIAFQLAENHGYILNALIEAVNSGTVRFEGAPANLFTQLLYDPLTATCAGLNKHIVVVLDALDEFGRSDVEQQHLLSHLLPRWTQLPPCCKLFIASRSQGLLPRHLDLPGHKILRLEIGEEASTETINDIRTFFKHSFQNIQDNFDSSAPLATDSQLETLVSASSGLFIWASTVVHLVKQTSLSRAARLLVQNLCTEHASIKRKRMQPLYNLYRTVLNPLLGPEHPHVVEISPDVLAKSTFFSAMASAKIPLSARALASLCRVDMEDIKDIVRQLSPVMESATTLRFVHKSFLDYVTSEDFPLLLDLNAVELAFTDLSFKIMRTQLHFNMGKMPSSYMLNSEMSALQDALSEELRYASQFWGSHLMLVRKQDTGRENSFADQIDDFLESQFLYWVEAMSILGCLREAVEILSHLKASGFRKVVRDVAQDALSFLRQFALPISQSYPHIYVSAMSWTPTKSLIRARYLSTVPHALRIVSHGDRTWPAQLDVIRGHEDWIGSVAFSPDGSQIASGSSDETVRIWDTATRQPIGEPLRGHTNWVRSVAFSPDGSQIISGSSDNTIRIWDATTHEPIGQPLQGHNNWVNSVSFSPDGSRIVSASNDSTIRIWDAATWEPIGEPLRGHSHSILSVAFSPNGSLIVSGSNDKTIQVWDATTHQRLGKPLHGHNDLVRSVIFSPDGSLIISGSNDGTIRIWDVPIRQPLGEPLRLDTKEVNCVAFSPDGSQIVSGTNDKTIQIWDAGTLQRIGEPLRGHNGTVNSVAFSPDGSLIVSGSNDGTIRIWDAGTNQPTEEHLRSHKNSVSSVAFSPDGSQIISGSDDATIRIWDVTTREPIGEPLRGHSSHVNSVAFSSDASQIVSGSSDKTIRIWRTAIRQPIGGPVRGHNGTVNCVAFSLDGSLIASGSSDDTIRIWDAATRQPIGEPLRSQNGSVFSVAFSPNASQIVSGYFDGTIRIWDIATRRPVGEPFRGHVDVVNSVAFASDCSQIISGSDDATVRIWDATTRLPLGEPFRIDTSGVNSLALSPDGSQVVSGSSDCTIRIWDFASREHVEEPAEALKTLSFPRISHPTPLYCFLLHDGWVVDQHHRRLCWIPHHHLHDFLPTPGLIDIIGPRRMVVIDASDMRTGTEWSSCVDAN